MRTSGQLVGIIWCASTILAAWASRGSFDNLVKLAHLKSGRLQPFPNLDGEQYYLGWLRAGVGGTCWPNANAMVELFSSLGFDAVHAAPRSQIGQIEDATHGTALLAVEGIQYWLESPVMASKPVAVCQGPVRNDPIRPLRYRTDDGVTWAAWEELGAKEVAFAALTD